MIARRGLLGMLAAGCAASIVRTPGLLMPIKTIKRSNPFGAFTTANRGLRVGDVFSVGDASQNTSIWLVSWGPETVYRTFG